MSLMCRVSLDVKQSQQCSQSYLLKTCHHAKDIKFLSLTQVKQRRLDPPQDLRPAVKLRLAQLGASWKPHGQMTGQLKRRPTSSSTRAVCRASGSQICCASDFSTNCQVQIQYHLCTHMTTRTMLLHRGPDHGIEVDDHKSPRP